MKKIVLLLITLLLLVACSDDAKETAPAEQTTPDTASPSGQTDDPNGEPTDEEDVTTSNPLEQTSLLIPDALEEMQDWNSITLYTSYKEDLKSDPDTEYLQYLQYMREPEIIFADIQFIEGYNSTKQFYGSRYAEELTASYLNIDGNGFTEIDDSAWVVRDHIKNRYELLKFAYENAQNNKAEIDDGNLVETFELKPDAYEQFADYLQYITSIDIIDGLDLKSNYKKVEISIVLSGLSIFGYAIEIDFTDDDIDGLQEIDFLESFETIDELEEIKDPMAG